MTIERYCHRVEDIEEHGKEGMRRYKRFDTGLRLEYKRLIIGGSGRRWKEELIGLGLAVSERVRVINRSVLVKEGLG